MRSPTCSPLGVTLFRMFTRAYPYGEVEPFSRPRFGQPPASVAALRPDLPAWLDQVLLRLIAVRREDRFDDAMECLFALEHGELHAAPAPPRWRPLIERDPLRFWQIVAAVLAACYCCCRRCGGAMNKIHVVDA